MCYHHVPYWSQLYRLFIKKFQYGYFIVYKICMQLFYIAKFTPVLFFILFSRCIKFMIYLIIDTCNITKMLSIYITEKMSSGFTMIIFKTVIQFMYILLCIYYLCICLIIIHICYVVFVVD